MHQVHECHQTGHYGYQCRAESDKPTGERQTDTADAGRERAERQEQTKRGE